MEQTIEIERIMINEPISKKKYKYFRYDDEYISGWQYFWRNALAFVLCFLVVGFYLLSVNAYKRSRSLGHSKASCNLWAIWGFLSVPLAFTPVAIFTNTLPHWYLWFSNGVSSNVNK